MVVKSWKINFLGIIVDKLQNNRKFQEAFCHFEREIRS